MTRSRDGLLNRKVKIDSDTIKFDDSLFLVNMYAIYKKDVISNYFATLQKTEKLAKPETNLFGKKKRTELIGNIFEFNANSIQSLREKIQEHLVTNGSIIWTKMLEIAAEYKLPSAISDKTSVGIAYKIYETGKSSDGKEYFRYDKSGRIFSGKNAEDNHSKWDNDFENSVSRTYILYTEEKEKALQQINGKLIDLGKLIQGFLNEENIEKSLLNASRLLPFNQKG